MESSCLPFSSALDSLPQALWLSGTDNSVVYCNPKFCEILGHGFKPADVVGKPWHALLEASGFGVGLEKLLAASASGQLASQALESSNKQSRWRALLVSLSPLPGTNPPAWMGRAEVEARSAQNELHGLITSGITCLRQGISVIEVPSSSDPAACAEDGRAVDKQQLLQHLGRLLYANPALEQMSGQSLAELQSGGLASLLDPSTSVADIAALVEALHARHASSVKLVCTHKGSNVPCWTSISVTPICPPSLPTYIPSAELAASSPLQASCARSSLRRSKGTTASRLSLSSYMNELCASVEEEPPSDCGVDDGCSIQSEGCSYKSAHQQQQSASVSETGGSTSPIATSNAVPMSYALPASGHVPTGLNADMLRRSNIEAQQLPSSLLGVRPPSAWGSSSYTGSSTSSKLLQTACQRQPAASTCLPEYMHYLCVHEDITASVSQEMGWQLQDHALSSCSEGITIADPSLPDAPLVYVNDAFLNMTGYSREEVIGRNCRFLQGADTSRDVVATLKAAVAAKHKATVELLNYRKGGETFWNRLSITPMFNAAGELVSYIGVQSDVTELIRRKEEERRLLEAKMAAESATEAKSMFLANMSHELRTPLNGMMATTQLLLDSCLDPEQRDLAETILESGTSLLGILGDILDFSKLDHGSITLRQEPIYLRGCIESCLEIVAPDASKKGLTLYYTSDEQALAQPLMADGIRLRQVLTNLLSNAVKFTERGEVHVDVRVEDSCTATSAPMAGTGRMPSAAPPTGSPQAKDASVAGGKLATTTATRQPMGQLAVQLAAAQQAGGNNHPWHGTSAGLSGLLAGLPAGQRAATATDSVPSSLSVASWGQQVAHDAMLSRAIIAEPTTPIKSSSSLPSSAFAGPAGDCSTSSAEPSTPSSTSAAHSHAEPLQRAESLDHSSSHVDACSAPAVSDLGEHGARQSKQWLHIAVRDTGIGIPPELASVLFQCFKQGSESMARKYGGTGLGLAISKRLAELMQGTVWMESEGKGKGCTFHLQFPADFQPQDILRATLQQGLEAAAHGTPSEATGTTPIYMPSDAGHHQHDDMLSETTSSPYPGPLLASASASDSARSHAHMGAAEASLLAFSEDYENWSGVPLQVQRGMTSYASSTVSSIGCSSAFSFSGGAGMTHASYSMLLPEDRLALEGRCVLIDTSHAGLSTQISQSCRQLGMQPRIGSACGGSSSTHSPPPRSDAVGADAHSSNASSTDAPSSCSDTVDLKADILVVSADRAAAALKAGWKGRPVVALGARELLSPNLWPLVVLCSMPVMHMRLAHALVKSMVLLRWSPGRRAQGPKLTHQPISPQQIADFKSWRDKGYTTSMRASPASSASGQTVMDRRPWGNDGPLGFPRPAASYANSRRSLDNSSLDRGRLQHIWQLQQQALAANQAANASNAATTTGALSSASSAGTAPGGGGSSAAMQSAAAKRYTLMRATATALPCSIPENTVPTDEEWRLSDQASALVQAAACLPNGMSVQLPTAAAPAAQLPPLRILIAEDNKVNQKVVLKVLQSIDARTQVDVVENGLQALRAVEQKTYDLILMDIHMPEMDGLEATRRIVASQPPATRPRIIALSADTLQDLHDKCREAGIEEFIVKPFRVEDLKRVMHVCGRSPHPATATSGVSAAAAAAAAARRGMETPAPTPTPAASMQGSEMEDE